MGWDVDYQLQTLKELHKAGLEALDEMTCLQALATDTDELLKIIWARHCAREDLNRIVGQIEYLTERYGS